MQSKVAFPPIGIETLVIGEIDSVSVFKIKTKEQKNLGSNN
jgi:hypothetical protein